MLQPPIRPGNHAAAVLARRPTGARRAPFGYHQQRKEELMAERAKATVRLIDEAEAAGRVAAIFADIKATKRIDFVPNFWRALATNTDHLELIWTRLKALMHPEAAGRTARLDPLTREIIALAVSATNGCAYCVQSHTAAVRKLGLDVEALGEVLAIVALFNSTNAIADGYQVEPDVLPPQD
jgi:AhpD family alkylhydroperoxidase